MNTKDLIHFRITPQQDYDQIIKIEGNKIPCYSDKMMDELYSDKEYTLVGEVKRKNKKEPIGTLHLKKNQELPVSQVEANSKLLWRKAGYVCVGPDEYVVLLKPRFVFLLWFLGMLAGIVLAGSLFWMALQILKTPDIIDPDHPLPSDDPYVETLPNEGGPVDSPDGGGSVSMIYTLKAEVDLSDRKAKIDFRNPTTSNHDVAIIFYLIANGREYPIAQSGLIKAGHKLSTLELDLSKLQLSEGVYTGKYRVLYYNPKTGEKALVEPEITDVTILITP